MVSTTEELMPGFQELILIISHQAFDRSQLVRREPSRARQADRIQPELRQSSVTLNVNVRWLGPFVAEEEEPIRTDS